MFLVGDAAREEAYQFCSLAAMRCSNVPRDTPLIRLP